MRKAKTPHDPEKLQAILDTALRLFNKQGFDATPVPMIADQAKVGTGTIYRYFKNKEELVNSLFQRCKQRMQDAIFAGAEAHQNFEARFRHYCTGTLHFALEHPAEFAFLELHNHEPYLNAASRKIEDSLHGGLHRFLEEGRHAGELRNLPPTLVIALVLGAITGVFKDRHVSFKKAQVAAIVDACWAMVRAGA